METLYVVSGLAGPVYRVRLTVRVSGFSRTVAGPGTDMTTKNPKLRIAKGARKRGPFASIEDAISAVRDGKMIVVVDDEDRENEGDLTMAAAMVTPEAINFMTLRGRGLVCLAMTADQLDRPRDSTRGQRQLLRAFETAMCVSIDAREGTTTGISAPDRAQTVRVAIDPGAKPRDLRRPGHVFPLRARTGGVLVRTGHTEAAVDLARIAGLPPAGVICEIMNDDGTMARVPELMKFAKKHGLPIITIADLIQDRMRTERLVKRAANAALPTDHGAFRIFAYENQIDSQTHVALVRGEIGDGKDVLVRVHSKCLTGDVFHSARCDCGAQLDTAMERIAEEGRGVLLYLNQEGRGIGLSNKIRAVRAAGPGARHRGSQRAARLQARSAGLWHRRADPERFGRQNHAAADQQSTKVCRAARLRPRRVGGGSARDSRQ